MPEVWHGDRALMQRRMTKNVYLVLLILGMASCSQTYSGQVAVKSELIGYRSNALHLEYSDRTGEWFDAATFRITDPSSLKGKEIVVHYGKGSGEPFGTKGSRFEFTIVHANILDRSRTLFYGDLRHLKRIE